MALQVNSSRNIPVCTTIEPLGKPGAGEKETDIAPLKPVVTGYRSTRSTAFVNNSCSDRVSTYKRQPSLAHVCTGRPMWSTVTPLLFHPIHIHSRILLAKAFCSREGQGREAVRRGGDKPEGGLWVIMWMTERLADSGIWIQVAMLAF